jgi:hypothetical protein
MNWFTSNPANPESQIDINPHPQQEELRDYSGFAYVGNYATEIQAVIDAFAIDATAGYLTWAATAFGGVTGLAQTGPSLDSDGDGLNNFLEYAFALDPTSGANPVPASAATVVEEGSSFLEASFSAREDADLQYTVRTGTDLSGWTAVTLSFSGGTWASDDPGIATVATQVDMGGGVWVITVRDAVALAPGSPRLISLKVEVSP